MAKNVQISMDLFVLLVRYHYLQDKSPELQVEINKAIEAKIEAMIKHDLYSTYKNKQLSPAEQEAARKEYLDRVGMRDSFRWPSDWKSHPEE